MLTPFEQAKRYAADLGKNLYPNYIVVCNFKEFQIHDMSDPNAEPVIIKLEDLPTQVYRLAFLADVEKRLPRLSKKYQSKPVKSSVRFMTLCLLSTLIQITRTLLRV